MRRTRLPWFVLIAALAAGCDSATTEPLVSGSRPERDAPVLRLVLDPARATIHAGEIIKIHATAASADRSVVEEIPATYASSDEDIATVGNGGVVRGKRPGLAVITVRWGTSRAFAEIAVLKAAPRPAGGS